MFLSKTFPGKVEYFDFLSLIKKEKNGRMRTRLLALQNLKEGKTVSEICSSLKIARDRVRIWSKRFLQNGVEGLYEREGRGRKSKLSVSQRIAVAEFIEERAHCSKGGRLFGEDVVNFISANFEVKYCLSSVYLLMHELGFSWITSRAVHPKRDLAQQEDFKKNLG